MPKAHQEKYAKKHDEVETDLVALKNAFLQYHQQALRLLSRQEETDRTP